MKKILVTLMFVLVVCVVNAQRSSSKFGARKIWRAYEASYWYKYNLREFSDTFSLSLSFIPSIGGYYRETKSLSGKTNTYPAIFAFDVPVFLELNCGLGATRKQSKKKIGMFVGLGIDYSYYYFNQDPDDPKLDIYKKKSFGPAMHFGLRFRWRYTYTIKLSCLYEVWTSNVQSVSLILPINPNVFALGFYVNLF